LIGLIAKSSGTINPETLAGVISSRYNSNGLEILAKGIGCGFLMELAVWTWREKKSILGVLFCVPAFILSGFYHSVADAFYYIVYWKLEWWIGWVYILTVLGNFIGCSLRRLVMPYK
jgi:formate/nitrite transporter FocA (FNT family)